MVAVGGYKTAVGGSYKTALAGEDKRAAAAGSHETAVTDKDKDAYIPMLDKVPQTAGEDGTTTDEEATTGLETKVKRRELIS